MVVDLDAARAAARLAESKIDAAIKEACAEFTKTTGLEVDDIRIEHDSFMNPPPTEDIFTCVLEAHFSI